MGTTEDFVMVTIQISGSSKIGNVSPPPLHNRNLLLG